MILRHAFRHLWKQDSFLAFKVVWFDCLASQVSSKIGVIESLLSKCDKLVIGGGMVFTFMKVSLLYENDSNHGGTAIYNAPTYIVPHEISVAKCLMMHVWQARGLNVGSSLVEEDKLALAKELEAKAKSMGVKLILPTDVVIGQYSAYTNDFLLLQAKNMYALGHSLF
jgi:3-phosphoglycerate kinase